MDGLNTKDIWQALTSNNVTEPFFDGVFPLDGLNLLNINLNLLFVILILLINQGNIGYYFFPWEHCKLL